MASFAQVYAARSAAVTQAAAEGSTVPIMNFLSQYGQQLPTTQVQNLTASYFGVVGTAGESRADIIKTAINTGLEDFETGGARVVDSLVKVTKTSAAGTEEVFRTVRSYLQAGEGLDDIYANIQTVLEDWQQESGDPAQSIGDVVSAIFGVQ